MTDTSRAANLLAQLEHLDEQQLRRLLVEHLTKDQSRLRVADGGLMGAGKMRAQSQDGGGCT